MKSTILIIDDEPEFLDRCAIATQMAGYDCDLCESAEEAYDKFHQKIYDGIVCDLRIPFQGNGDGGSLLAQKFAEKHPTAGVVLVSQFFSAAQVTTITTLMHCAFVEKNDTVVTDVVRLLRRVVRSKLAFICMPFAQKFENIYEAGIKPAVLECGFKCVRADELTQNKGILEAVIENIKSADVVVADMTGRNPNVYYEVGYAHALGKEVILIIQKADDMPFDTRGISHIVYDGRITILKTQLAQRLKAMHGNNSGKK